MKASKKEIIITIRVCQETKDELQLLADKAERKLADYIRWKLNGVINWEKENEKRI